MSGCLRNILLCFGGFVALQQASGIVLSYYRFEEDFDTGIGLEARDELDLDNSEGFALFADQATVDASASPGSLPPLFEPVDGSGNNASLDGLEPNINARAAHNLALDVAELTVELYARTEESSAVMVGRSTTEINGSDVQIQDGFRIYDTQELKVDFWTYDGTLGTQVMHTISTTARMDEDGSADGNAEWRHVAFSYEDGIGRLYLDEVEIGSTTVSSGSELYWGDGTTGAALFVGIDMDGYDFSKTESDNGYLDELRFSEGALSVDEMLPSVPEPTTSALFAGLLALLHCARRRRK